MNFTQKLGATIEKNNSLLCVGLDPVLEKIPQQFKSKEHPLFDFNKFIIDQTHDLVCAFKPNSAFYEAYGVSGIEQLKQTIDYINHQYTGIPVILDAKRGDIGNTNEGYVKFAFDYLEADAITVMPYMGIESLDVFFERKRKGVIIGCHSSNPGAREFQEILVDQRPLYVHVAEKVFAEHGDNPNCLLFMGATYPEQIRIVREIVSDMTLLVPGVGAQEGVLEETLRGGLNSEKKGLIINSSRGIIYAENPREEANKLKEAINKYR